MIDGKLLRSHWMEIRYDHDALDLNDSVHAEIVVLGISMKIKKIATEGYFARNCRYISQPEILSICSQ